MKHVCTFLLLIFSLCIFSHAKQQVFAASCDSLESLTGSKGTDTTYVFTGKLTNCASSDGLSLFAQKEQETITRIAFKTDASGLFKVENVSFPSPGRWGIAIMNGGTVVNSSNILYIDVSEQEQKELACGDKTPTPNDPACPSTCPATLTGELWVCQDPALIPVLGDMQSSSVKIILRPKPGIKDTYIVNQAFASIDGSAPSSGGNTTFDGSSKSLEEMFKESATTYSLPLALIKAIAHLETGGMAMTYTEAEVKTFSTNQWWAGKTAEAPTLAQNDPLVIRGLGYNTCQYKPVCGPGNDVRGMMQFLNETWLGVKKTLKFADGHDPDRRINHDAILGTGSFVRDMTKRYPEFGFPSTANGWTDAQVRATGLYYCTGNPRGNGSDAACGTPGNGYDDVLSVLYKKYSN